MARKRLIFFTASDPATEPSPVAAAYRFATAAASAGLEAEVRLAGDAVLVADAAYVASVDGADALRAGVEGAPGQGVAVSVCPRSVASRGIRDDQLAGIGARPRSLAEILTEVADGRAALVHL